jgi:hypothetical protein
MTVCIRHGDRARGRELWSDRANAPLASRDCLKKSPGLGPGKTEKCLTCDHPRWIAACHRSNGFGFVSSLSQRYSSRIKNCLGFFLTISLFRRSGGKQAQRGRSPINHQCFQNRSKR